MHANFCTPARDFLAAFSSWLEVSSVVESLQQASTDKGS